jgi:hypothetical protein
VTAPVAAPTPGPITATPQRAASQPPADHFAFAAVLESLPRGTTKAGDAIPEKQPHPLDERPQEHSPHGQTTDRSLTSDDTVFASLPFTLRTASIREDHPQSGDDAHSLLTAPMKGPGSQDSGASLAAGAKPPAVGRLVGERAFHFGASAGVIASRAFPIDAPFAPGAASLEAQSDLGGDSDLDAGLPRTKAMPAGASAAAVPSGNTASVAPRASAHPINRGSSTRAASHETGRSGRKFEISAPPPVARVGSSATPVAQAESSAKTADIHLPDSTVSAGPAVAQTGPFGALSLTSLVAGASFEPEASPRGADTDLAAPASARAGPAPSALPVREIDVDLSPGGLEDVSMTMRLTGDKLSVVIRAASSQTLGSIEGARDAIADRNGGDRPAARLAHSQAGGRQHGWECERERVFR